MNVGSTRQSTIPRKEERQVLEILSKPAWIWNGVNWHCGHCSWRVTDGLRRIWILNSITSAAANASPGFFYTIQQLAPLNNTNWLEIQSKQFNSTTGSALQYDTTILTEIKTMQCKGKRRTTANCHRFCGGRVHYKNMRWMWWLRNPSNSCARVARQKQARPNALSTADSWLVDTAPDWLLSDYTWNE